MYSARVTRTLFSSSSLGSFLAAGASSWAGAVPGAALLGPPAGPLLAALLRLSLSHHTSCFATNTHTQTGQRPRKVDTWVLQHATLSNCTCTSSTGNATHKYESMAMCMSQELKTTRLHTNHVRSANNINTWLFRNPLLSSRSRCSDSCMQSGLALILVCSRHGQPKYTGGAIGTLRRVRDKTRSAQQGANGSPPGSEGEGGCPLGPRSEGLNEMVLSAVALHGAH